MTFWVLTFIAEMLEVKGTLYFFDTFMEKEMADIGTDIDFCLLRSALSGSSHRGMDRNVKMYPDYTGYVFPKSGLL